ncbi:hypothetical protein Tco_0169828 [Tanacetum coccineum]
MANLTDMLSKFVTANTASTSGSGTLPGNTVTNPKEDLKGITTRSGATIQGPKAVNHDTEVTKDTMPPANNGSTEDVQPPVVQIQTRNPNPEPMLLPTKAVESSVNEPPEVELKELPPHLEYAFLEGDNKLPVIIAKDLKDEEKAALLKVLKSPQRAIAWKLSIKSVTPELYSQKSNGIVL